MLESIVLRKLTLKGDVRGEGAEDGKIDQMW